MSGTRDCNPEQLKRNTNSDVSHSTLAARQLDADYQINGFSGPGTVRNVAGICPDITYRTYYDRALLNVDDDVWQNPGTWRPQIVVVNLGSNAFTGLTPGEPWTPDSLAAAHRTAYGEFLQKLRRRYGAGTTLVAVGFDSNAEHACGRWSRRATTPVTAAFTTGSSISRAWTSSDVTGTPRLTTTG
ncbi:hypothetical protein ABZ371_19475 [Streptomyces sp. NPDC005899]|uniref:hypothetical protein n=1 Tax=Streptomyces sp. NPDC005899 TaxID=3155716 RepID=UPI0033E983CF